MIDFECLLRKYISLVQAVEGTDFVSDMDALEFSADEIVWMRTVGELEWKKSHP